MMSFTFIFKIANLAVSFISLALTVNAVNKRSISRPLQYYAGVMVSCTIYTVSYLLEIHMPTLEWAIICLNIEYLGLTFIPVFWILMAWSFNPNDLDKDSRTRDYLQYLMIIPIIFTICMWTNPIHHFVYKSFHLVDVPTPITVIGYDRNIGFWIINIVLVGLYVIGAFRFIYNVIYTKEIIRRHLILLLVAAVLPIVAHILLLGKVIPLGLDIVPITFALSGLLLFWGMFRIQLFDFIPIAKNMVLDAMKEAAFVIDTKFRIVECNQAAKETFLKDDTAVLGKRLDVLAPKLWERLKDIESTLEIEFKIDGEKSNFNVSVSEITHNSHGYLGNIYILHDITEVKYYIKKLETLASFDSLTGLFNRRHFFKLASMEVARIERAGGYFSIIIFDLDNFKLINDSYGHLAGDAVLQTVGQIIKANMRSGDLAGRCGGEEFGLLYHNAGPKGAEGSVERLRRRIEETPVHFGKDLINVTASFGISFYEANTNMTLEKCFQHADEAMYKAKKSGRNRICHYS